MSHGPRPFRMHRRISWGAEPGLQPEVVPRSESDEARRSVRDWLRDRDEDDTIEFEEVEQ